jgi:hypothetical protein
MDDFGDVLHPSLKADRFYCTDDVDDFFYFPQWFLEFTGMIAVAIA